MPSSQVNGLSVEWVQDKQIVVYRLESPRQSVLNAWSEIALETMAAWPKDHPYCAIHDVSRSGVGLLYCRSVSNDIANVGVLPGARSQVGELVKQRPGWAMRLAVVVSGSASGYLNRFMSVLGDQSVYLEAKPFFMYQQALDWVTHQSAMTQMASRASLTSGPGMLRYLHSP